MRSYGYDARLAAMRASENTSHPISHKMGAAIFDLRSGKVVEVGWAHTPAIRFRQFRTMCAERHAILRSALSNFERMGIAVYGVSRSGTVAYAKPCILCAPLCTKVGFSYIEFCTQGGWVELNHKTPPRL